MFIAAVVYEWDINLWPLTCRTILKSTDPKNHCRCVLIGDLIDRVRGDEVEVGLFYGDDNAYLVLVPL